jgi:hypothetical protein
VPRSSPIAVLAVALLGVLAPGAASQSKPVLTLAHDSSLDGTAREIHSGFYAGDRPAGDPLAARVEDTYETFALVVPEGTRHSSLQASIAWASPKVDLDLSVYRLDAAGRALSPAIARSAARRGASELITYTPAEGAVAPGRYLIVVDNYCSRDADDDPRSPDPADKADCGIGGSVPDEDDFHGAVTLGNQPPAVAIAGPDAVPARQAATYTAVAADPDGKVSAYLFDLDGNGVYELDSDGNPEISTSFPERGTHSIAVMVVDDSGGVATATKTIAVGRRVAPPDTREPLISFRLSRPSFGGAARRRLIVTYRLRERARVDVTLSRGSRRLRLIARGVHSARRTYRIVLKPARLRRGVYTVRISVHSASGKRQVEALSSRRR